MSDVEINLSVANRQLRMVFDLDSPVHQSILNSIQTLGAYEPATTLFLGRVLRRGDTFIDVGAHIGFFSLIGAALVGEAGRVIAVEPFVTNFERLRHNVELNNLTEKIQILQTVVSDANGTVDFHINKDNDGGHALWDPALHSANILTREAPEKITVRSMTLSSLIADVGCERARLMKIDTEGAEAGILESGSAWLSTGGVDFIIAEVNASGLMNMGSNVDSLFTLARDLGYVVCLPNDDGSPPVLLDASNRPNPQYVYNVVLARPEALAAL